MTRMDTNGSWVICEVVSFGEEVVTEKLEEKEDTEDEGRVGVVMGRVVCMRVHDFLTRRREAAKARIEFFWFRGLGLFS